MLILEIILIAISFALWCFGVFFYFKKDNFVIILIASFLVVLSLLAFIEDSYFEINPPKTIEENGYVYQLENFQPEQTIERYGETYVLVEE